MSLQLFMQISCFVSQYWMILDDIAFAVWGNLFAQTLQHKELQTTNPKTPEQKLARRREVEHKSHAKYRKSAKGKATKAKEHAYYRKSAKGKATKARERANRRSREKGVINDLTAAQWNEILFSQNNLCNACSVSFDEVTATRDHIKPVVAGGGLTKDNVQALCGPCNSSKGTKWQM